MCLVSLPYCSQRLPATHTHSTLLNTQLFGPVTLLGPVRPAFPSPTMKSSSSIGLAGRRPATAVMAVFAVITIFMVELLILYW